MTLNLRISNATATRLSLSLTGFCLFFLVMLDAAAVTRYVSDDLEITLRSGQSTQHQILRMVKSGTPLEILQTNAETNYSRVRTPQGIEGWVLTQYLMDQPGAQELLATANKKLERLEEENKNLKSKLSTVSGDKTSLDKDNRELLAKSDKLEKELSQVRNTAANALNIESERNRLVDEARELKNQLQFVQQENLSLKDRSEREWFVRGAGVVIAGIVIGLILPKIRFRRRSSWNSLS